MKSASIYFLTFLIILASNGAFCQANKEDLDIFVNNQAAIFMKDKSSMGLSIGLLTNGTGTFYNYGTTTKGFSKKPTANRLYEIGSITKLFVSLVLANAVLEHRVNLNDDIRKYLPGDYPNLAYNNKPVTLLHLSNTTSGIPETISVPTNNKTSPDSIPILYERAYRGYTEQQLLADLHLVRLDTVPGFNSRHSNAAALVLAYILEKIYHSSIDKLVGKYVLGPAKLQGTHFLAAKSHTVQMAKGYNQTGLEMPNFGSEFMKGVGGLSSTTADLLKFLQWQFVTMDKASLLCQQKTVNAGFCDIGLTWRIYKHEDGNRQFWAEGATYGYTAYIIFYPEINTGMVFLTNESDPSTTDRLSDIPENIYNFLIKNKQINLFLNKWK